MNTALTIAGSDCSGGAGIQADIKTMMANGVYAMSVVTALTAQNTTGVSGILEVPADFLEKQLDAVFSDIFPDAVKIGMLSSPEAVSCIAAVLKKYEAKNIVIDPVMVSTSGSRLLREETMRALREELLPLAAVITPNIPEAGVLTGMSVSSARDMEQAAERMGQSFGCQVLIKGGHGRNDANDYLYGGGSGTWFRGARIDNPNTHGTGCTLSSAIAVNLAKGSSLPEAVRLAKEYITNALRDGLNLGKGSGPLNHGYAISADTRSEIV